MLAALDRTVIPHIKYKDASIKHVIKDLKQKGQEYDPENCGVSFFMSLPNTSGEPAEAPVSPDGDPFANPVGGGDDPFAAGGMGGGDPFADSVSQGADPFADPENTQAVDDFQVDASPIKWPQITLELENVPLSEAVRYAVAQAGLQYHVTPISVFITERGQPIEALETRAYPLPETLKKVIKANPNAGISMLMAIKDTLTQYGIRIPENAKVSINDATDKLIVDLEPREHKRLQELLDVITPPNQQVRVTCELIELTPTRAFREFKTHFPSITQLKALPASSKQTICKIGGAGMPGANSSIEKGLASKLTFTAKVAEHNTSIHLDINWQHADNGNPDGAYRVESTFTIWDGKGMAIPVPNSPDTNNPRFLIISAEIINPAGIPIRDEESGYDTISLTPRHGPPNRPERPFEIREILDNVIIPKVRFEDAPIATVFDYLRTRGKALNPTGEAVNIVLRLPDKPPPLQYGIPDDPFAAAGGDDPFAAPAPDTNLEAAEDPFGPQENAPAPKTWDEVTVTMDFDNIPLGETIRYICNAAGLKYVIDPYAVVITDPSIPIDELQTQLYPIESDFLKNLKKPEDDLKDFFGNLGVDFPQGSHITHHPSPSYLVATNTPKNLRQTQRLLRGGGHNAPQLLVTSQLIRAAAGTSTNDIQAYTLKPKSKPPWRVLHRFGSICSSEMTAKTALGESRSLKITPVLQPNHYTTHLSIDWQHNHDRVESQFKLWDGERIAMPLQSGVSDDDPTHLLIGVRLLRSNGDPIRSNDP